MARPAAILTRRVTFGPASSLISGADLTMSVSFSASVSGVVWAATGAPLIGMLETVTTEPGMQAYVDLPLPGQAGFIDGNGNEIRDWTYRAAAVYLDGVRRVGDGAKVFSLVAPAEGEAAEVDLDTMIPATSNAGVTVFIPDAWTRLVEDAAELVAGFPASDTLPRYVEGELQTPDGDPIAVGAEVTSENVAAAIAADGPAKDEISATIAEEVEAGVLPKLDKTEAATSYAARSVIASQRNFPTPMPKLTLISTFQTGHGFASSGVGTFDLDHVAADAAAGNQYARITTNGAGGGALLTKHGLPAFDSTGRRFAVLIRSNVDVNSTISVYLYNAVTTNFGLYTLNVSSSGDRPILVADEWTWVYFSAADLTSTGGTYDPAAITGWRLRVADANAPVVFDINAFGHFPRESAQGATGIVTFSVDDGYLSHRTYLAPKLAEYGWAASAFPISSIVNDLGTYPAYMVPAQLRELETFYRWDIGGHAFDLAKHAGGGYPNGWTDDQIISDILANIDWLQNVVGVRWSGIFAWPGGGVTKRVKDIVSRFYTYARSSKEPAPYQTALPSKPLDIASMSMNADRSSTAVYTDAIASAAANKTWLIFRIHDIKASGSAGGTQVNQADVEAALAAVQAGVAAGTLRVLTMGQVARLNQNGN